MNSNDFSQNGNVAREESARDSSTETQRILRSIRSLLIAIIVMMSLLLVTIWLGPFLAPQIVLALS